MVAHRFSASILVGLLVPGLVHGQIRYGTVDLGHVDGNLAPQGRMLALAYDDARILFEAMRQAKSADGAKVRDALAAVRFEGLTGPVSFAKDHTALRPLFVVRLKGGNAEVVKRYDPEADAAGAAATSLAERSAAR